MRTTQSYRKLINLDPLIYKDMKMQLWKRMRTRDNLSQIWENQSISRATRRLRFSRAFHSIELEASKSQKRKEKMLTELAHELIYLYISL